MGVGPFSQRGLYEALGLAVGLGRVGLCADMLDAETGAGASEEVRLRASAVVGHDAGHGYAEAFVLGDGLDEEGGGAVLFLVWEDA